jgi:putative ABC transport system permease protein
MSPLRLALRTLLLGPPRARSATLLIAASLCVLDLFAGHIAGEHARLEYQAVVGERLGHMAITSPHGAGAKGFDAAEARRIRRIAESIAGVVLVVPQIDVAGVASTGSRAALFQGAGIVPAAPDAPAAVQPNRLEPGRPNGIAVSKGQARTLGLHRGSPVTLTAVAPEVPPVPVNARVVDIFSTAGFNTSARSLLMPFGMAQSLLDTSRIGHLVVYLSNPAELDARRADLVAALRGGGLAAEVQTWRERSAPYAQARRASDLEFACVGAIVLVIVGATLTATISMNALERRREMAMLRALGMRARDLFTLVTAEALWMVVFSAGLSVVASGLIAWVANRAALSWAAQPGLARPLMLVELDFGRMLVAMAAVLALALLASLAPALRAARADVARDLAWGGGHPGW